MNDCRNHDVLSCWKEIAQYLERSVRTCQRWVRTKGLPVSYPGGRGSSPYASKAELDAWRLARRSQAAKAPVNHVENAP